MLSETNLQKREHFRPPETKHFPKTANLEHKRPKHHPCEEGGRRRRDMARRVPTSDAHLIHPALSISLLAAWIAATIAIVAALCGTRSQKKPTPPPSESSSVNLSAKKVETWSSSPSTAGEREGERERDRDRDRERDRDLTESETEGEGGIGLERNQSGELEPPQMAMPLPLPPILRASEASLPQVPRSASVSHSRGFSLSPSVNLARSFSVAKAAKHLPFTKEERMQSRRDKSRQSDSLWMKTIILGEKCKVPNEEEEVYDEKGQKVETYRPKGPKSVPVSRTNSFMDPEAVPG